MKITELGNIIYKGLILLFIGVFAFRGTTVIQKEDSNKIEYLLKIRDLENKVHYYENEFKLLENAYKKDSISLSVAEHSELTDFFADHLER